MLPPGGYCGHCTVGQAKFSHARGRIGPQQSGYKRRVESTWAPRSVSCMGVRVSDDWGAVTVRVI